ncbi:glycosyltransferase family 1 protein [Aquifex pyrophilus]
MYIYIDGLFYKGSGIGRYYESLVKEFAKRGIKIYTCVPKRLEDDFEKDFKDVTTNIEPIFVDYEKFSIKGFFNQSKILKALEKKVDLFFYPHINLPLYIPSNTITTIHDLRPFTQFWDRSTLKKEIFRVYIKRALKYSKGVITISNHVKFELQNVFKAHQNKIKVIYEFVDDKFHQKSKIQKPIIEGDYILFVGNRKKHKNLTNLILAFNKIKHLVNAKLVIAGSKERILEDEVDKLIMTLNLKEFIVEILSPSDDELINLYQYAKLFVFPSLFEGFGLPPLEAAALNCPVITSNIPVLREILTDEIACFNPYDPKDISDKIYKAMTDNEFRLKLLNIAKKRLQLFQKEKIIEEFIEYFHNILRGKA